MIDQQPAIDPCVAQLLAADPSHDGALAAIVGRFTWADIESWTPLVATEATRLEQMAASRRAMLVAIEPYIAIGKDTTLGSLITVIPVDLLPEVQLLAEYAHPRCTDSAYPCDFCGRRPWRPSHP